MFGDFHVHTRYSSDAVGDPAEHVAMAEERGLVAIGFSEHADFDPNDKGYGFLDLPAIRAAATRLRDDSPVSIFLALEVDFQPRFLSEIRDTLARFRQDFGGDYAIGSVHSIEGRPLYSRQALEDFSPEDIYRRYRDLHLRLLETELFDVVGHLDFPRRYLPPTEHAAAPYLEEILAAIAKSHALLEVNAGAMRKPLSETSPAMRLVKRFAELGGRRVVIGSDAHSPADVGLHLAEVYADCVATGLEIVAPPRGTPEA